jgi:hypothetical protein
MNHPASSGRRRLARLAVALCLPIAACASDPGASRAQNQPPPKGSTQTASELDKIMTGLQPTERFVANADAALLWQAASGYMERAFPLDELPAGVASGAGGSRQLRTRLVEWHGDGFPHRTRVYVEIRNDPSNPANMRLRVTALLIEAEPQLEQAKPNAPLEYNWRLAGSNQRVEETVADQIMRRYLALREGKPLPLDDEMILPRKQPVGG